MKLLNTILLLFVATLCCGQEKEKKKDKDDRLKNDIYDQNIAWSEGSVMLKDGTELKGVLRYQDHTGVLSYDNGGQTRSFTSKSIVAFEFFDEALQKQRIFYSLEYTDPLDGIKRYYFFEVLSDLGKFAVMSKTDPMTVEEKSNYSGVSATAIGPMYPGGVNNHLEYSQVETIFFMSSDGTIEPYLKVIEKDVDRNLFDNQKTRNKFVDKELFKKYAGDKWTELEKFADDNGLRFKRRGDLLEIINHYKDLISD